MLNDHLFPLENKTIRDALSKIDSLSSSDSQTIFIVNKKNQLQGSLTDGDIRRALIQNSSVDDELIVAMNKQCARIDASNYKEEDFEILKKKKISLILN